MDGSVQTEPQKKEELMLQFMNLELERKKLEIQNLLDEHNRKERARQAQENNIEQLNRTVQLRLQELA